MEMCGTHKHRIHINKLDWGTYVAGHVWDVSAEKYETLTLSFGLFVRVCVSVHLQMLEGQMCLAFGVYHNRSVQENNTVAL